MTRRRGVDNGRVPGRFVALPFAVLRSEAYKGVSPTAKAMMVEVALQYVGDNNGKLLLSRAHLAPRGWFSADIIHRATSELIAAKLIVRTVMGGRAAEGGRRKASWYALTWYVLDWHADYDAGVREAFRRGAYDTVPAKKKRPPPACKNPTITERAAKNTKRGPPYGPIYPLIGPSHGPIGTLIGPAPDSIGATVDVPIGPVAGHHLEKPSAPDAEAVPLAFPAAKKKATKCLPLKWRPPPPIDRDKLERATRRLINTLTKKNPRRRSPQGEAIAKVQAPRRAPEAGVTHEPANEPSSYFKRRLVEIRAQDPARRAGVVKQRKQTSI